LHAPQAIAALKAGKHVLVEKPMALNTREADEMVEVANQSQRQLAVAYYRRFWPTFEHVKELIDSGELGQIVLVRMALHSWFAPAPDDPKAWRVRPELAGGGVLHDVGSHRLDLLAWWLGLPKRVVAEVGNHTHGYAADDSATAMLIFRDRIPSTVSFHWNSKTWADDLHIVGTEASIAFNALDSDEMTITSGRESTRPTYARHPNAHYGLVDDFASAICAGRRPRFNGVDGLAATRIMDWMTQSSASGAWVEAG
jgi:predicted dehydrogenase